LRPAWLEIDLDALAHNFREIQSIVGPAVKIIAVAKCNAYGHGAIPVVRRVLAEGASLVAVALLQEAMELREVGVTAPLLVLGASDPSEAPEFVAHDVCATVTDPEFARALSAAAVAQGRPGRCHIKIDSGMGRQGVRADAITAFAAELRSLPGLQIEGLFSHFASAGADPDYTELQRQTFVTAAKQLEAVLGKKVPLHHLANSAGILHHPDSWLDAVRPGALLYGIANASGDEHHPSVRPVMALKAKIAFLKDIGSGESVGYSRTFIAPRATRVAILPLGYGDGYPRALSNNADVLVHGRRCPVVGRVCMDCIVVDVGAVPEAQLGDEVVLLGRQGNEKITAGELAQRAGTIVQEIVSRMSTRLPRVFLGGAEGAD
jgi:alanine racemase